MSEGRRDDATRTDEPRAVGSDVWLPSLLTETPQAGFELAIALARRGVKYTQPDTERLHELRPEYAADAGALIAASHVVAVHFATVAAANDHWIEREEG
jgi:hypothetical protein